MVLLSIVTSAYNEEEGIGSFLRELDKIRIPGTDIEFVVVDNGSKDRTGRIIDAFRGKRFRMFHNKPPTKGIGAGYIRGFSEARGDYIAMIRSDWQEDPKDIPKLYKMMVARKLDSINGVRTKRKDPFFRSVLSIAYNVLTNVMFPVNSPDINGAPKLFRKSLVRNYKFIAQTPFFDTELIWLFRMRRAKMAFQPAKHFPRRTGKTTVNPKLVLGMFTDLFYFWPRLDRASAKRR